MKITAQAELERRSRAYDAVMAYAPSGCSTGGANVARRVVRRLPGPSCSMEGTGEMNTHPDGLYGLLAGLGIISICLIGTYLVERFFPPRPRRYKVQCVGCGEHFEASEHGALACPICKHEAETWAELRIDMLNKRDLDNYITGHWGEDYFKVEDEAETIDDCDQSITQPGLAPPKEELG